MSSITHGAVTLTPELITGYKSERQSGNLLHPIIGRGNVDVTYGPFGLRTGTLVMLCLTHADALAMETLHLNPGNFSLTDPDLPGIDMLYVPSGTMVVELDDETRLRWLVSIDFQEVTL